MKRKPKSLIGMILGLILIYPVVKLVNSGYISQNMAIPAFIGFMLLLFIIFLVIGLMTGMGDEWFKLVFVFYYSNFVKYFYK